MEEELKVRPFVLAGIGLVEGVGTPGKVTTLLRILELLEPQQLDLDSCDRCIVASNIPEEQEDFR